MFLCFVINHGAKVQLFLSGGPSPRLPSYPGTIPYSWAESDADARASPEPGRVSYAGGWGSLSLSPFFCRAFQLSSTTPTFLLQLPFTGLQFLMKPVFPLSLSQLLLCRPVDSASEPQFPHPQRRVRCGFLKSPAGRMRLGVGSDDSRPGMC